MLVALCPVCSKAQNYCLCPKGDTPMTDKTIRDRLIEWVAAYKDVAERNALAETPEESADYLLSLSEIKEGQELREKVKSGKLVELADDQTWPKIPEHCAGIVLERDRILRATGFRQVKVKG